MDIHKPKPWRGFREFLKEYLIIVVGVLTALGAEAGVEWLHWRHLAEQHDADLRSGAKAIALDAMLRMSLDGCASTDLRRIAEALRQPGASWKGLNPAAAGAITEYLPPPLRTPTRPWPHTQWESALADGSLTHLPAEKLRVYTIIYRSSLGASEQQQKLFELMPELTPLAFDQTLSPQERSRDLSIVARLDGFDTLMVGISRSVLTAAANYDLWPDAASSAAMMKSMREHLGGCVREPTRADFQPGGQFFMPLVLASARGR